MLLIITLQSEGRREKSALLWVGSVIVTQVGTVCSLEHKKYDRIQRFFRFQDLLMANSAWQFNLGESLLGTATYSSVQYSV